MVKTRESEAARTRVKLVAHGRRLFARGGQAAVGVIEVSKAAGVTTGALYHHFSNRQALLRAVLEDVATSVATRAIDAMKGRTDPWERLMRGVTAVLDACLEDDVKLVYNEAASILGLEQWRALEESKTGVLLMHGLTEVAKTGQLKPVSLSLLAAMVKGAVVEAAMSITRSKNPKKTRREAGELLQVLFEGLRVT